MVDKITCPDCKVGSKIWQTCPACFVCICSYCFGTHQERCPSLKDGEPPRRHLKRYDVPGQNMMFEVKKKKRKKEGKKKRSQ